MNHRIQFGLVLSVFFLVIGTAMFGWVYLTSLNNKFTSVIFSPRNNTIQQMTDKLVAAEEKITILESQVKALQDYPNQQVVVAPVDAAEANIASSDTVDIFVDEKCLADKEHLDQCVVLAEAKINDTVRVLVKPAEPINETLNKIVLEFFDGENKITDYSFFTNNLLDLTKPIATIAYFRRNDITLQVRTSPDDKVTIMSFDGQGWIEYTKNISKAEEVPAQ